MKSAWDINRCVWPASLFYKPARDIIRFFQKATHMACLQPLMRSVLLWSKQVLTLIQASQGHHSHGVLAASDAQHAVVVKADATQRSIGLTAATTHEARAVLCEQHVSQFVIICYK